MFFQTLAYAAGQKGGGGSSGLVSMVPLLLMFVIFYFILIRPQQKQVKRHKEFIQNLKKGDRVVTSGGLHGTVTGLTENVVTLEVAENVRVKVSRNAVSGLSKDQPAEKQ